MTGRKWRQMLAMGLTCALSLPLLPAQENIGQSDRVLNIAVFTLGQVAIKRKGWINYVPVVFGTNLQQGDLLRIDNSSKIDLVCSDLKMHEISTGIFGIPCPTLPGFLRRPDGGLIRPTRSVPGDGSVPVVLYPRRTKLLSSLPTLRWTPVADAQTYTVIVRAADFYWSTTVNAVTETKYPESGPRLKTDVDYKLIVEADGQHFEDQPGLGLGFSILDPEEKRIVEGEQRKIENLGLPEGPTQFLIAYLFVTHGLNSEAIQKLERISNHFKVAAVQRLLGDLYLDAGLIRFAERCYLASLDLSAAETDDEGQMWAHLALAHIYRQGLGNPVSAVSHLDAALAVAKRVGDDAVAGQSARELAEMRSAGHL